MKCGKCGGGFKMFLQRLGKTLFVCIICGFVAGVLMAIFLPPIFIAVLECVKGVSGIESSGFELSRICKELFEKNI